MPSPDQTGYIILSLKVQDNDVPESDPAAVMERLYELLLGDDDISEARLAFAPGDGTYRPYGPSWFLL